MAGEWHDYEKTIATLAGEVAALRCLVATIAATLPDRALYSVGETGKWERPFLEGIASKLDTDGARDFATGFYDVTMSMHEGAAHVLEERESGDSLRLVQPATIPDDEMLFPEKGW